jgi:uncharacterized membrane protein YvbJ
MKKCPYCDEEIQDDAIKCRSCGEMIEDSPQLLSPDSSARSNGKPISKNKTFLIPIILVILLPLLTISFVYYERYYENNRYELEQKKDKAGDTLREKTTLKDPKDAEAYINRGLAHNSLGNYNSACDDWLKACKLGNCDGLNWAKQEGVCQ